MPKTKQPARKKRVSRTNKKSSLKKAKQNRKFLLFGLIAFVLLSVSIVVYALAGVPEKPEDIATPRCYGNGTDGPRVEVVYLYNPSSPRASSDGVKNYAKEVDRWLKSQSFYGKQSQVNINFVTDARLVGCDILVTQLPVSSNLSPREQIIAHYGGTRSDRRYMVFTDGTKVHTNNPIVVDSDSKNVCVAATDGKADGGNNDVNSPNPANPFNVAGSLAAAVSLACESNPVRSITHEFLHSLGAVAELSSANYWSKGEQLPNTFGISPGYTTMHVTDIADILYPIDGGQPYALDPGCDDYFCPTNSPNIGAKLKNHWNVWKSDYLYRRGRTYPDVKFIGDTIAKEYNVDQTISYAAEGIGGDGDKSVVAASVTIDGVSVEDSLAQQDSGSVLRVAGEINLANFTSNHQRDWFNGQQHELTVRFRNKLGNLSTDSRKFVIKSRQQADTVENPLVSKVNVPEAGRLPSGSFKSQSGVAGFASYCYETVVCGNVYILTHNASGEKWPVNTGHWTTVSEAASIPPPVNDLIVQNTEISNGAKLFSGKSSSLGNIGGMKNKKIQACWYVRPFNRISGNDIDVTMKINVDGAIKETPKSVRGNSYQELCAESDVFNKDIVTTGNNPFELIYDNPKGSTLKVWSFRVKKVD